MDALSPLFFTCFTDREDDLQKLMIRIILLLLVVSLLSCAGARPGPERTGEKRISDISGGLPTEGLWRENIALIDMNGDGFLDIVAPPPRKAEAGQNKPFIFMRGKDGKWSEGDYTLPKSAYGYGGIAAGDIDGDGYPDMVLAVHSGGMIILQNNKGGGFVETPFHKLQNAFHSRSVQLVDVNGDGRLDIVALSESPVMTDYKPQGLLVGLNKDGRDWDVHLVEDSIGWFGDSFSVGDITGDGKKDIAVAVLAVKEGKKLVWFGDGKGDFKSYDKDIAGRTMPKTVRTGDVNGDGKDEVVLILSTLGPGSFLKFSVQKWTGEGFQDISSGIESLRPIVFDLADIDGNGKKELVALSEDGIHILEYQESGWTEVERYGKITPEDAKGARDLRVGKNKDGSLLIVYNLGDESPALHHGLRAYMLRVK